MALHVNTISIQTFIFYLFATLILAGCGGGGGGGSSSSTPAVTVDALSQTSVPRTLIVGETFQLSVDATYSDASTEDITSQITWNIANESVLSISSSGLVTALSAGSTKVTAAFGGVSVEQTVSVKALDELTVSPGPLTLSINDTQQLSVSGRYTDNTDQDFSNMVDWSSSDASIATVSETGLVSAVSAGTITISATSSATFGAVSGSISVTVLPDLESLSVTNVPSTLKVNETFQLAVTGTYSDASEQDLTSQITWTVANDDTNKVSVSSSGLITALSAGTANVTASFGGLSVQQSISVKALTDLSITPSSLTLAINSAQQLSVTGLYTDNTTEDLTAQVAWSSSNSAVASVSNSASDKGEVTALTAGTASISASMEGTTTSLNVIVSPATLESIVVNSPLVQVAVGLEVPLSAKGIYSDGTEQIITNDVAWSLSSETNATIDADTGLLSAIQAGSVSAIATKGAISSSILLTISPATITEISITPAVSTLAAGTSATVNVTAIFSDNTKQDVSEQVTWTNTDDSIATIEAGTSTVDSHVAGSTKFTASLSGQSADLSVIVTEAVLESLSVLPANTSVPLGVDVQFTAQGIYTDGSVQDLTSQVAWFSSDESVALISNAQDLEGLVDSASEGATVIRAVSGDIQQQTNLSVENAALSSIEIQPANQEVAKGTDAQVSAYGYYTDGSKVDLSADVIWSTSQSNLVDLSSVSQGIIHSLGEGNVLLSAELDGISSLANIAISSATLVSISVEADETSLPNGFNQTLLAMATYTDNSTQDITKQVAWQSSDVSVASVGNSIDESGLLRAHSVGQSTITASLGDKSGQISIDVTNAVLSSIQISSTETQLNVSETASATAVATYSDNSTQDVTSQVNWASNDLDVAAIGNTALTKGVITAIAAGNANVTASLNGVTSNSLAVQVTLDPDLPKAITLMAQPNIILNDGNDTSTITVTLVPTGEAGVIADGTPITLTITENGVDRVVALTTLNGSASYDLQSSDIGFISLAASSTDFSASSGVASTGDFAAAISVEGQARALYENNILRKDSKFIVLLRNLSNREFGIEQIDIFYFDPNNSNALTDFPESPLTDDASTSNGLLTSGEFTFVGYQLDSDIEASVYGIIYTLSDQETGTNFNLNAFFNFNPGS